MARRRYLRTDSDCILLYRNNQFDRYGECEALIYEEFEKYVFKGQCGTDACPFYKPKEKKKDPGNWVVCMR